MPVVAASGLAYGGVLFGDVPPNTFAAPAARNVTPGGATFYTHVFTAGSAGNVSLAAARNPSPAIPGWSMALYRDLNCNGAVDAGEPMLAAPVALGTGQAMCVIARHDAPAGAPPGATELATLTASFSYTGASPALNSSHALDDLTTVVASGLAILKTVDRVTARPGDTLTYTIQYTNLGALPVSSIVINDATPAFTEFASANCGTLGAGLGGCGVSTQPAVGATGPVRWTLAGSLDPGATGSVTFVVRVQ